VEDDALPRRSGAVLEGGAGRAVADHVERPLLITGHLPQRVEQVLDALFLDQATDEDQAPGDALRRVASGAQPHEGHAHGQHAHLLRRHAEPDDHLPHLLVHDGDRTGPPEHLPLEEPGRAGGERVEVSTEGRDQPRNPSGREQRHQPLRNDPVDVHDVRREVAHGTSHRERAGEEERGHLRPPAGPGAQILEDRTVGEVRPATGEESVAADLVAGVPLPPESARHQRREDHRVEGRCLLARLVGHERRRPVTDHGRERGGQHEQAGTVLPGVGTGWKIAHRREVSHAVRRRRSAVGPPPVAAAAWWSR
jgi:hypothetical protein